MPRFVLTRAGIFGVGFLISGCWFDANYKEWQVACEVLVKVVTRRI
jgi:hypothetical protein